jgi:hypothetical protein
MMVPAFTLNFISGVLDPRVTFTRALNTASRVNSSGFIETVNADVPRFDYDRTTLAPKGLLIEETRTNLLLRSSDASQSPWVSAVSGVAILPVVTPNAGVSPDGTNNAVRVQFDCTNAALSSNRSRIQQSITVVNGTTYAKGVWVKAYDASNVGKTIRVLLENAANTIVYTLTNQWVRVTPAAGAAASTSGIFIVETRGTFTGQTADILMWNATVEAGAFLTSDIITGATATTRNADVATITGTNFSDWWQTGFGGATVQALPSTVSGVRPLIQFDDGTANEIIALRGNTTNPELYIVDGGAPQAQIDAGTIAANTAYSLTGWWQTNFCAARKDNGARVEDLTATIPTVTQARLGSDGTNYLNGHLATINYYDQFSSQIYNRRKNKVIFTVI